SGKGLELLRVLAAGTELHATGDVDGSRPHDLDRLGDVHRRKTAGQDHRHLSTVTLRALPGKRLARAAGLAGHVAVEQVIVGAELPQGLDVRAAANPYRLDHLAPGAPRHLG